MKPPMPKTCVRHTREHLVLHIKNSMCRMSEHIAQCIFPFFLLLVCSGHRVDGANQSLVYDSNEKDHVQNHKVECK